MPEVELEETEEVTYRLDRVIPAFAIVVAIGLAGFRFFSLISAYSVNVLFFDQWDFLQPFFEGDYRLSRLFLVEPTPFREGLGLIVDRVLYSVTNWDVRAEGLMIGSFVFMAMLLALALKRRLFGSLSVWDVAIPLMFLTLGQYEAFIGTPNPSYSGIPLLLMMVYCLALSIARYRIRIPVVLILNFFLVYTGYGLLIGPLTIVLFAVSRRDVPTRWTVGASATAAATLGAFFIDYRFEGGVGCFAFPNPDLTGYPRFMALMVGHFAGVTIAASPLAMILGTLGLMTGAAILGTLALRFFRQRSLSPLELSIAVLLSYSALFAANASVGRVCIGLPSAAFPSRYVTHMIPGALGVYLFLCSMPGSKIRGLLLTGFAAMLIPGCVFVDEGPGWYANGKRAWARCYVLTEDISRCDQVNHFPIYPRPEVTHLKEKLDFLKARHLNLFSDF